MIMLNSPLKIRFFVFCYLFNLWCATGCAEDNNMNHPEMKITHPNVLAEPVFALYSTTEVGDAPRSLSAADFNGDGIEDMAVANMEDHSISILLGYGIGDHSLGIFEESSVYSTGLTPVDVKSVDLDNDGRIDIVTANTNGASVSIFWGEGDGTFSVSQEIYINSVNVKPTQVVSADITGDGIPDIITSNGKKSSISFIRGKGGRAYATPQQVRLGLAGAAPAALTAADFNNDGRIDLAVANKDVGKVSVLIQGSNGKVASKRHFDTGKKQLDIAAADIDNDGIVDLVTPSITDNAVYVLKGKGDGTFQSAVGIDVGNAPVAVTPSDMDRDGIMDLVVTERNDFAVTVLFGDSSNPQGGLSFTRRKTAWVGRRPMDAVVFDATGDGISDIAVANRKDDTVDVLQTTTESCTGTGCANVVPEMCSAPNLTRKYRRNWTLARMVVAKIWEVVVHDCDRSEAFAERVIERIYAMEARLEESTSEAKRCRIIGRIDGALMGLDIVQEYCGLHCFLSGDVVGTIAAKVYCDLAIETDGALTAEPWVRPPVNICGMNFELACDTTFFADTMSYVNDLGECLPYTLGDYFETWDNSRAKSCDYSLNKEE